MPIAESKYRSKIPVATTYLLKPRHKSTSPETEHIQSSRPVAVNVLAADSRIASARSGVEEKAAELERLQDQIREVNTKLKSLNVSGGGSGRAKYRSIISRGRPLPSFMDEERTPEPKPEPEPKVEYRRDSATVIPPPVHANRHRYSKTKSTEATISVTCSTEWFTESESSSEGRRHRARPSDTQGSSTTNGQETDETFTDSDRVSLKNFPSTPRSRRSRIPRRPISSMMSTCSSFSDMPTVYETRMATPVTYQDARVAGYGVSTVYNHRPAQQMKQTPPKIEPIGELDEGVETDTLASEQIDQDLGTLGGYLVTPDPTPSSLSSTKPKFVRQCTPMRPAALRVVNGTPSVAESSGTRPAAGPLPPKFALSPAVRPQHLSQALPDKPHPAFRNDPFCATPPAEDIEEEQLFDANESLRYGSSSPIPHDQLFHSSPGWPLVEGEPEEEYTPEPQTSSSRYPGVFRKFFNQQNSTPVTHEPDFHAKSTGSATRPLRTWLRKITPRRSKHDSAQPTPESITTATNNQTTAVSLRRAPTARVSAPPSLLPYRNRDSTLRFEQMLMKEIGGHAGIAGSDAGGSTSGKLARRASIASLQLLSRSITEASSSVGTIGSGVCPPPVNAGASPVRKAVPPLRDFHLRNPTISTFRCSMAFV